MTDSLGHGEGEDDVDEPQAAASSSKSGAATRSSRFEQQSLSKLRLIYAEADEPHSSLPAGALDDWSRLRRACYMMLHCEVRRVPIFDLTVALVVLSNICIVGIETDNGAECLMRASYGLKCHTASWLIIVNYAFLGFYTMECAVRMYVGRSGYLRDPWNYLDMFVVGVGIAQALFDGAAGLDNVSVLRLFRVVRLVRILKIFHWVPTLWSLMSGLAGALQAMFWGFVLIMMLLLVWSIFAVEVLHPIAWRLFANTDDESGLWCRSTFSTISRTTLYLFMTLVASDDWRSCAIPILEDSPLTLAIFALALVSVQLGFLNLLLAVIVDQAAESREKAQVERREAHRKETAKQFHKWEDMMQQMDIDGNGTVSLDEFTKTYAEDQAVQSKLASLGFERPDLELIFELMDVDNSGSLGYGEFITSMLQSQVRQPGFAMAMVQMRLKKIDHMVNVNLTNKLEGTEHRMTKAIAAEIERCARPQDAAATPTLEPKLVEPGEAPEPGRKLLDAPEAPELAAKHLEAGHSPEAREAAARPCVAFDLHAMAARVHEAVEEVCRFVRPRETAHGHDLAVCAAAPVGAAAPAHPAAMGEALHATMARVQQAVDEFRRPAAAPPRAAAPERPATGGAHAAAIGEAGDALGGARGPSHDGLFVAWPGPSGHVSVSGSARLLRDGDRSLRTSRSPPAGGPQPASAWRALPPPRRCRAQVAEAAEARVRVVAPPGGRRTCARQSER